MTAVSSLCIVIAVNVERLQTMIKKFNKIKVVNRLALLAVLTIAVTNPWATAYIDYAVGLFAMFLVIYSIYFFIVSLLVIIVIVFYFMYSTRGRTNIPSVPSKRTKAVK